MTNSRIRRIKNSTFLCSISCWVRILKGAFSLSKLLIIRFSVSVFHILPIKSVVRLYFDLLHGIEAKDVPLAVALEFGVLLGYDGQLKQNSKLEIELFASTIKQLKKTKMSRLENALMWLYVKTWGAQGQHVLDQHGIWKFRPDDLDAAIMGIAFPKKEKKSDRAKDLQDLILGRFEGGGLDEFYQWAKYFRNEVSASS